MNLITILSIIAIVVIVAYAVWAGIKLVRFFDGGEENEPRN